MWVVEHVLHSLLRLDPSMLMMPFSRLLSFVNVKLHNLRFQGIGIQQNNLPRLPELWHAYQADRLSLRAFNNRGIVAWLVADEEDVRALFDDEGIFLLEGIAT